MNEDTGKLSSADIRHFSKWLDSKRDYSELFWAFTCFSRQDYADEVEIPYLDEVCYGLWNKNGGCVCEMLMVWERIGGDAVPVIQSFSESFVLLTSPVQKKVFEKLMKMRKECFTPEEFSKVLLSCGFRDMSDRKLSRAYHDEHTRKAGRI